MTDTGYIASNGKDLINIFAPYSSGTTHETKYKVSSGADLSTIFQPWDGISKQAEPTGFKVGTRDLNELFENIVGIKSLGYNPFSASTTPTGYTYGIFSTSDILNLTTAIGNVYGVVVGGGGGAGSGLGYNGGGAGGSVRTFGPITLNPGNYIISIGAGGTGGRFISGDFNGEAGSPGGTTTLSGPGGFSYTATGGGGGGNSAVNQTGAGGTNSSSGTYGTGGSHSTTYTNVQPGSGVYTGDGQNGYLYTFEDGTGTTYYFGGGGAAGGRNSSASTIPNPYLGAGGFVGTRNGTTFTNQTGGCGGNGYQGITRGNPGYPFTFNSINYNSGAGGGASGNNSSSNYYYSGSGSNGLVLLYFPSI